MTVDEKSNDDCSAVKGRRCKTRRKQKPRGTKHAGSKMTGARGAPLGRDYFAKTIFATWALAREAAFLCTTPDFTALSIADV